MWVVEVFSAAVGFNCRLSRSFLYVGLFFSVMVLGCMTRKLVCWAFLLCMYMSTWVLLSVFGLSISTAGSRFRSRVEGCEWAGGFVLVCWFCFVL